MLYNSDGLPAIFYGISKGLYFFKVIVGTSYQYLPYFQNKNQNRKNMQYENINFSLSLSKIHDLVF